MPLIQALLDCIARYKFMNACMYVYCLVDNFTVSQ